MERIKGFKVSAAHQVCLAPQAPTISQNPGNTYPRSSKKRQITFATISSFFSNGCKFAAPGLTLVRAACFSVAVAPKQSAKSIVEDCYVSVGIPSPIMVFCSHSAREAPLRQSNMERANQKRVEQAARSTAMCVTQIYSREAPNARTKMRRRPSG